MTEKNLKPLSNDLAIWIIFPGLVLNLILGFLFTLLIKETFFEIKSVEEGDFYFQVFRMVFLLVFLSGFFIEKIIPKTQSKFFKLILLLLISMEIGWNYKFTTNEFMIDYIFHQNLFYIFFSLNCFSLGYVISSFRHFRLWSFLAGSIIFILYTFLYKTNGINAKDYLLAFLIILGIKLSLNIFSHDYGIFFERKKPNDRDSYSAFFYSGVILFSSHIALTFLTPTVNLEPFIFGVTAGALLFSSITFYGLFSEKVKLKFLVAEIFLIGNIIITANQSGFNEYSFFLFFMDMALLTYFRPSKISKRFVIISIVIGIAITGSLIFFLPSTSYYKIRDIAVVIFTILFLFPLYSNKFIGIYHRVFVLLSCTLLALVFHSPFDFSKDTIQEKEEERILIPYLLANTDFENNNFIYFSSDLPFDNKKKFPEINILQNKILVLGMKSSTNILVSYASELMREKRDFLILCENISNDEKFLNLSLRHTEFPLFHIYYPTYSKTDYKESVYSFEETNPTWTKNYIFPKIKNMKSPEEILAFLDNTEKYGGNEIKGYTEKIKNRFFESYINYSKYFFNRKNYTYAIKSVMLALKFGKPDMETNRIAYESIIQISPEPEYIPLLNYLSEISTFKESILKRLIPVLLISEKTEEALQKIDDLISFYKALGKEDEMQTLTIEKANIFLGRKDIVKAGEIIQKEIYRNPSSIPWNKLNMELNLQREEIRQRWISDKSKQMNIVIE